MGSETGASVHIVDTNKFAPNMKLPWGSTVTRHVCRGPVMLDPAKFRLHLEPEQLGEGSLDGHELSKRLTGWPDVLGLCELWYLYTHQELIPESWKTMAAVIGWGTILHEWDYEDGCLVSPHVACLIWCDGRWFLQFYYLDYILDCACPAVLLANE